MELHLLLVLEDFASDVTITCEISKTLTNATITVSEVKVNKDIAIITDLEQI